jgi:hypothetical protein
MKDLLLCLHGIYIKYFMKSFYSKKSQVISLRIKDQQNINDNIVQHLWSSFYRMCPKAVMFTGFPKTIKDKHWPHGLW